MRRLAFGSAIAIGLAGFGLVAAILALLHGWQRPWLTEQIEARLARTLGQPVSIGAIDGPLHRSFRLSDIRFGGPDGALHVVVDGVEVEIADLWDASARAVLLDRVRIARAQVRMRRDADGRWPWQGGAADDPESGPLSLRLRIARLEIDESGVELVWTDRSTAGVRRRPVAEAANGSGRDAAGGPERRAVVELGAVSTGIDLVSGLEIEDARLDYVLAGPREPVTPWLRGRVLGAYQQAQWQLREMSAEGAGLWLEASGEGDHERLHGLTLEAEVVSLLQLAEQLPLDAPPLDGRLALGASLVGPIAAPRGSAAIALDALRSEGRPLGSVSFEAKRETDDRIEVGRLSLANAFAEAALAEPATLRFDRDRIALANFALHNRRGPGTLAVAFEVPRAALAAGTFARDPATRGTLASEAWPIAVLTPVLVPFGLDASGRLDADLAIAGSAEGLRAEGDVQLTGVDLAAADWSARTTSLDLRVDGPLARPLLAIEGEVGQLEVREVSLGALALDLTLDGFERVEIDRFETRGGVLPLRVQPGARVYAKRGHLRLENWTIVGEGSSMIARGTLSAAGARDFQLELSPLELEPVVRVFEALANEEIGLALSGRLAGHIALDGRWSRPTVSGALEVAGVGIDELVFDRIDLALSTHEDRVRLETEWLRGAEPALSLDLFLPAARLTTSPAELLQDPRFQAQAYTRDFELAALASFLPKSIRSLGGVLNAQIELTGRAQRPAISGRATLERGALDLAAIPTRALEPIRAELSFEAERLELVDLAIGEPGSGLTAQGYAQLDGTTPSAVDARIEFDSFALDAPGLVRGRLDGPLRLSGTPQALDLSGRIDLANLRIEVPEPDSAALKDIRVITTGEDADATSIRERDTAASLLDRFAVDVVVRLAGNAWARGRGVDVELEGAIEADKQRGAPLALAGEIATVRGDYEIYGRRFRIERGIATLDGAAEPDPILDIRARHRVRDVEIYALIAGRLSEPTLRFESNPELSETDIASYLVLGRPAAAASDEDQRTLDTLAAQIAAGAALREFERFFGGRLPVDQLDLRVEDNGGRSEVHAGVGKYVGDRLFLYYERGFGENPVDELRAEYELTPNWSVESSVTGEGETGGDLVFEIEF